MPPKANPFMSKAMAPEAEVTPPSSLSEMKDEPIEHTVTKTTPRAREKAKRAKAVPAELKKVLTKVRQGGHDDDLLEILDAVNERREALQEKVRAQVKLAFGEEFDVAPKTAGSERFAPAHPAEVDLSPAGADAPPASYGAPTVHDEVVTVATDPMASSTGDGDEYISTGAQIG